MTRRLNIKEQPLGGIMPSRNYNVPCSYSPCSCFTGKSSLSTFTFSWALSTSICSQPPRLVVILTLTWEYGPVLEILSLTCQWPVWAAILRYLRGETKENQPKTQPFFINFTLSLLALHGHSYNALLIFSMLHTSLEVSLHIFINNKFLCICYSNFRMGQAGLCCIKEEK